MNNLLFGKPTKSYYCVIQKVRLSCYIIVAEVLKKCPKLNRD